MQILYNTYENAKQGKKISIKFFHNYNKALQMLIQKL